MLLESFSNFFLIKRLHVKNVTKNNKNFTRDWAGQKISHVIIITDSKINEYIHTWSYLIYPQIHKLDTRSHKQIYWSLESISISRKKSKILKYVEGLSY